MVVAMYEIGSQFLKDVCVGMYCNSLYVVRSLILGGRPKISRCCRRPLTRDRSGVCAVTDGFEYSEYDASSAGYHSMLLDAT